VTLNTRLSSESARVGDAWSGSVLNDRHGIPAGSEVRGTVSAVRSAQKGDRAMLDLQLTSITAGGRSYAMHGGTEAIIAGSPRARNLGAIGAATAEGAVVGHAIGGSGKGTLIGAIVGGGAATGVVSQTKGWQVVLKSGTPLTFTTSQAVAVRL
jgi:transposase